MEERTQQDINLGILWSELWRRLVWIVGLSIVLALIVWLWSRAQPRVYEASATVISTNTQAPGGLLNGSVLRTQPLPNGATQLQDQDGLLGSAFVEAQPLPSAALTQAVQSTELLLPLVRTVQADPTLPATERTRLVKQLRRELQAQQLKTIQLDTTAGGGLYTLSARASTAAAAKRLADLGSQALLNWDVAQDLQRFKRAQAALEVQLSQIDARLASTALPQEERQALVTRRTINQQNLAQITILASTTPGGLSLLSSAVEPAQPVAPRPLRNALLTGMLTLLLGLSVVALRVALKQTVNLEEDLLGLHVPTLSVLRRVKRRERQARGMVQAARQAGFTEALGFLRVNLMSLWQDQPHPVLMVSSTAPGEGKSTLTAALADNIATGGGRVLIIDADLRRGSQMEIWQQLGLSGTWHQLSGEGGARTTQEALRQPEHVQVLSVRERVDLLPSGPGLLDSLNVFNRADLAAALQRWRQHYDLVLIDSPPLLALADGMVLGASADAVLLVAEQGHTPLTAIRTALRQGERSGANIIGCVINKSRLRQGAVYHYMPKPSTRLVQPT
ncbi:AAA family ATPase [Deinococcus sonorensis]|uniref:AAA family ATPase n=2 Tax=Deinococcus sonorensis TaxID=309891 RepID=A0AAU7UF88_9DEIO